MSTTTETCPKCHDTGAYGVTEKHERGESYMTMPCPCRAATPPRYGKAGWWTEEVVHSVHFGETILLEADLTILREVPMSADNFRLHRTKENMYWPCTARIEVGDSSLAGSQQIREFAAANAAFNFSEFYRKEFVKMLDMSANAHWGDICVVAGSRLPSPQPPEAKDAAH